MNYNHSCVIDAQNLYKTFVLVLMVPEDGAGTLNLGELGTAHVTRLSQDDPTMEQVMAYIPSSLGDCATVYAGATDDGHMIYYAISISGAEAAVVLADPMNDTVVTYVGARDYQDGAYHIVDNNGGGEITFTFAALETADVRYYMLQDGESLVVTDPPTMRPYAGADGFVSPKWDADATAWTEAATEEEIAAWEDEHPAPAPAARKPSETEQLRADIDYLAIMTGVEL